MNLLDYPEMKVSCPPAEATKGKRMIPITVVDVRESEPLVLEVLRSGSIAQGPMVARLEREFAEAIGVKHCIAVNNGTTALVAALEVCDIEAGQEVITSPFTFVATLNAALEAGATVRFADIKEDDFCMDPNSAQSLVSDRTKVLMPVHLYGQSADMKGMSEIVEKHGLMLVEDAAQAHGATYEGRSVGTFGLGCFSLYATKNMTSGEGGLITTNDDTLADRLRILRNQGMRERYKYEMIGHNYRLTDIHAAIAVPQVAKMHDIARVRQKNAQTLSHGLSGIDSLTLPGQIDGRGHVWHQYTVVLKDSARIDRDAFIAQMSERGIGCGAYYPKLAFDYDCFRDDKRVIVDDVPVAAKIARSCVSLPVHQHLTSDNLATIVETVTDLLT
jgi:dTDP-4-amino-4,6-dideoxygalactose transaminase